MPDNRAYFARILAATILWYTADGMVRPSIAVLLRRTGLTGLDLAVVLAAYNLAALLLALPISELCRCRAPQVVLGFGSLLTASVLPLDTITRAMVMVMLALRRHAWVRG